MARVFHRARRVSCPTYRVGTVRRSDAAQCRRGDTRPKTAMPLTPENPGAASLVRIFFVPGHLNGFELALVRLRRIILKSRQRNDPFMQVGEAHRQRIDTRMRLHEGESYVFGIGPGKCSHQDYGSGSRVILAMERVLLTADRSYQPRCLFLRNFVCPINDSTTDAEAEGG